MKTPESQATEKFDAFISYSQEDIDFARKLEKALEGYNPPKDIKAPQRYLRIFRDEVDITGVGGYYYSNGKTLASGSTYGTIILWDVDVQSWLRRANRNLTIAEWRQYLGDLPYQKTCPDLPVPEDAKATASPPVQEN